MSEYWKKRILEEEARAQKIAARYMKEQRRYYSDAIQRVINEFNALYTQIAEDGIESLTRSQLWQYSHYRNLLNTIEKEVGGLGAKQLHMVENTLREVFETEIGMTIEEAAGTSFLMLSEEQTRQMLSQVWSGSHYSERIYTNTNNLAARVKNDITDMVLLGKSPDEIKKGIIRDFGTEFYQADRLVRTEASHAFNQSALNRYQSMGVSQVEYLAEPDCCDKCAEHRGKVFAINNAPVIPVHPNCRCCWLPVVD